MMNRTGTLDRIEALVSPYGIVSHVRPRRPARGLYSVRPWVAQLGSGLSERSGDFALPPDIGHKGAGLDPDDQQRSRLIAIAEAAERYAGGDFLGDTTRWARADELDGVVVDLASVPACSARELAAGGCPLSAVDPDAVIRWVRGTDLASGEPVWVPAVMACYRLRNPRPGERFWYRISTGYSVHTDPAEAALRGLCEVIERDAVALTWLQRLPLPLLSTQHRSVFAEETLSWCERHFVETFLFDATTDVGVPTVYCVQIAEFDTAMRQVVSCGTGRTITAAADKALLEVMRQRLPVSGLLQVREDFRDFSGITDGAAYMGRPRMAFAFGFLTSGSNARVAPIRPPLPDDPAGAVGAITATLAARGMRAIAVDRTPRELADTGLTAVCVVVPALQPMSLHPLAQYRAHPRLYEAPALMGYPSATEEELNPWPQPFA